MFVRRNALLIRVVNSNRGHKYSSTAAGVVEFKKAYPAEAGHVRKSPYEDIVIPNQTLDKYVWNNISGWENRVAAVGHSP